VGAERKACQEIPVINLTLFFAPELSYFPGSVIVGDMTVPDERGSWTLLTGHGHVLVEISRNPQARVRDISAVVGLTERTVQAIIADLEAAGYLTRDRTGRRNQYTVNPDNLFRHSAQDGHRVGPFLDLLSAASGESSSDDPSITAGP
jgi:hypothetical protein